MKKTVLILALLATVFTVSTSFGQVYFHEDFQKAELGNKATADVDTTVWTLYSDNNQPVEELAYMDTAWKIYGDVNGDHFAVSPSYFKGSSNAADRWLVSSAILLTDAQDPVLVFRAKSLDSKSRDNLEVKISTTDSAKASFSKSLQTVSRAKASWEYHTIDLSEYKGQKIFLAFVQNSKDCYAVGLDDIYVGEKEAFLSSIAAPVAVIAKSFPYTLAVKADLFNAGSDALSSFTFSYSIDGGEVHTITHSESVLEPGAVAGLSLEFPVDEEGYHTVTLSMENAPALQTTSFVALHTAMPRQCFMWEAFSSGMCTACAPWNKVLHPVYTKLRANVPDNSGNFVMAKYQVDIPAAGDPMVTSETLARANYYNVNAAPTFLINGKRYQPSNQTYEQALADSIAATLSRTSNLKLDARLTRNENTFSVESSVTTVFPDPDNYELVVVLMEDSIHQIKELHNGEQDFFSIVRKMMTPASGLAVVPAKVGDTVKNSFSFTFDDSNNPRIYNGLDGVSAVAYLQNARTRQIIQALYLKADYPTTNDSTAQKPEGDLTSNNKVARAENAHLELFPNPADEKVNLRMESEKTQTLDVRIFNISGKQVHSFTWNVAAGVNQTEINASTWQAGTYFVGVYGTEGMIVKKLILR